MKSTASTSADALVSRVTEALEIRAFIRDVDVFAALAEVVASERAAAAVEARIEIARAIQEARPTHATRDYTPVDAAYDRAAEVARGGISWAELHTLAATYKPTSPTPEKSA